MRIGLWLCVLVSAHILLLLLLGCGAQTIKGFAPLTDANFTDVFEDEWVVLFHTPWCVNCGDILPEWTDFAQKASHFGIQAAVCDMTAQPGVAGRFLALHSPQTFHVVNGTVRNLPESVGAPKLLQYLRDRRWTTISPLPWWRAPDRRHMTVVAGFFFVAEELRIILSDVSSRYNLSPFWLYVAIFSASILLGILAGVLLVIVTDVAVATMRRATAVYRHARRISIEFIRRVCRLPNEAASVAASEQKDADDAWMLYWSCAGQSGEGSETFCAIPADETEEMDAEMGDDVCEDDAFTACTAAPASPGQQPHPPTQPQQLRDAAVATDDDACTQGDRLTSPTFRGSASMGPHLVGETGPSAPPLEQGDTIALSSSHVSYDALDMQSHLIDKSVST